MRAIAVPVLCVTWLSVAMAADMVDERRAAKEGISVQEAETRNLRERNEYLQTKINVLEGKIKAIEGAVEKARKEEREKAEGIARERDGLAERVRELEKRLALLVPGSRLEGGADGEPVISIREMEAMPERFARGAVRMVGVRFVSTSDGYSIRYLPGISWGGNVDRAKETKWISFEVSDGERTSVDFYAPKDTFGDLLVDLKRGTKLNIRGMLVKYRDVHGYAFVCQDLEVAKGAGGAQEP